MFERSNKSIANEIKGEVKLFILTGPTFIGWIVGLLHYPADSKPFLAAFQNALVSLVFLFAYGFFYVMNLFFNFPSENILLYLESILSFFYLSFTLYAYLMYRKEQRITLEVPVQTFLDRLFLIKL